MDKIQECEIYDYYRIKHDYDSCRLPTDIEFLDLKVAIRLLNQRDKNIESLQSQLDKCREENERLKSIIDSIYDNDKEDEVYEEFIEYLELLNCETWDEYDNYRESKK